MGINTNKERTLVENFLKQRTDVAFKNLYREFEQDLFRMALRLAAGDRTLAEDIFQELWIRAIEALPRFGWQSSLKTWLTGILINCFKEQNRKNQTSHYIEISEHVGSDFGAIINNRMDAAKALSTLPQGYREVLVLHDLEGYKHDEIGALLGISQGTSKSQLFHARKAMKKLLT